MGWDHLAAGGVETHILPVYPAGMLVEPFVEQLAETLKGCIHQALSQTASKPEAPAHRLPLQPEFEQHLAPAGQKAD